MSTAVLPDTQPSTEKKSPWLVSAPVDLIIGCGIWTLPILFLTQLIDQSGILTVSALFYVLTIFCNNPHYMATIYRAYGTPQDFQKYKLFTVYLTVLIILTGVIVHAAPILIPILFTVYITWSPWHYTAQNYGIGMMFARRAGAKPSPLIRHSTYAAYLASYVMWFLMIHSSFTTNPYVVSLGIPDWIGQGGGIVCGLVFAIGSIVAGSMMVMQYGLRSMLPYLALFSTQLFWFVLPIAMRGMNTDGATPVYFSTGALAFMHCAQYLWITQYYAHREREADAPWLGWSTVRYYGVMVLGGIALFLPGPWLLSRVFSFNLVDSYLIFVSLVNIHHFMLDGAIWKLRDGRIANLLLGFRKEPGDRPQKPSMVGGAWKWIVAPTLPARTVRYTAIGALVAVAAVDQSQYFLTKEGAGDSDFATLLNPNDSRVWQAKAKRLLEDGDYQGAREALERSLELDGLNPHTRRMIGSVLLESGDFDEAWKRYEEVETLIHPDLPTLVNVGVLSIQRGQYLTAREKLQEALRLDPARQDARLNLAELHFETKEYRDAARLYSDYLNRIDNQELTDRQLREVLGVTQRLGLSLVRTGRKQEGMEFLERAGAAAGANEEMALASSSYHELANTLENDKNFPAAALAYREAINYSKKGDLPTYPVYLYNYAGFLLNARGMKPEALVLFEEALAILIAESDPLADIVVTEIDRLENAMDEAAVNDARDNSQKVLDMALTFDPKKVTSRRDS